MTSENNSIDFCYDPNSPSSSENIFVKEENIEIDASNESFEGERQPTTSMKNLRGKNKIYDRIKIYSTLNEAISAVETKSTTNNWTRKDTRQTKEGEKRFYRCQKECPKTLYILLHPNDPGATVYISDNEHIHTKPTKRKLPEATIKMVEDLIKDGIYKNQNILKEIRKSNLEPITLQQLINLKANLKRKKLDQDKCKKSL